MPMSLAEQSLAFSGLFEAELLLELMLRYWEHPLAEDTDFRNELLEGTAGVLRSCVSGQEVMEDIPPEPMSFIAATWYVEWNTVTTGEEDRGRPRGQTAGVVGECPKSCAILFLPA